jgi:glycosyltransferase involved in cell wall biosynthesis
MRIRIAIVISHPIQHFTPMFRDLAKESKIDLRVFYCCDWGSEHYSDPGFGRQIAWDIPLLEGYEHEFLPIRRRPRNLSFMEVDNPSVGRRLAEYGPDVVWIHGYSHRTSWRTLRWAEKRARKLYFGDSELLHKRSLGAKAMKRVVLPWFFSRIDAFITIGDNNEKYYRFYGVPSYKMYRGAFPVDITRFRSAVKGLTADDRKGIRKRYGLRAESMVVLFVGKFISIKRPFDLIDAVSLLRSKGLNVEALFVGDGPLRADIIRRISERGVEDNVKMTGFVNQSDMPRTLFAGDVIAMCSEVDPHPLAVTESMAVGNVVVASDKVGCVGPTDSARPGINAMVYPCGRADDLAERLTRLVDDVGLRSRMGTASIELASTQDTSVTVSAVSRAIRDAGNGEIRIA